MPRIRSLLLRLRWPLLLHSIVLLALAPVYAQSAGEAAGGSMAEETGEDLFGDDTLDDDDLFADDSLAGDNAAESSKTAGDTPAPGGPGTPATDPATAPPALASSPDSSVEEIVIQGTAGQGLETDAASSVTAFDADDLTAMGVDDIGDVAQYTPNLEIRTAGSTTATFFIRGVGLNDFTANASGSVAIYQDDIALNLPAIQTGQIFDAEQVEILKGPQGGGPGRNASAGAIYIHSRKPSGETGGYLRFDQGNFGWTDTEGAIETPLVPDIASARIAYRYSLRDGLVENRCAKFSAAELEAQRRCGNTAFPQPGLGRDGNFHRIEDDLNDIGTWAGRAQVRLLPPDTDIELLVNFHGGRIDQMGTVGSNIGASTGRLGAVDRRGYRQPEIFQEFSDKREKNIVKKELPARQARNRANRALSRRLARRALDRKPFEGDYNRGGFERMDTLGGFVRAAAELDQASLTSTSGLEYYSRDRMIDADYSSNRTFEFIIDDDAWQFTQDFRAEGELTSLPIRWETGAYYLQEELNYRQVTLTSGVLPPVNQDFLQKTWSWGVYGGFSWEFLDNLELEVGGRFNWERKGFEVTLLRNTIQVCQTPQMPECGEVRRTFSEPTGTIALRWHVTDEVTSYWKYSHGWKGAQFNARDGQSRASVLDIATPERIDAYEFGIRGAWWDDRITADAALFWYDYEDYQVFTFTNDADSPPQRTVLNANDARIYGAEFELGAEPVDRLQLSLRFGWLESRFLDFTDTGSRQAAGTNLFLNQVLDYNGNRLPNTPRFKISGSAEYEFLIFDLGSVIPRWDFAWTEDFNFDPANGRGNPLASITGNPLPRLPEYAVGQKAYLLQNFRLSYKTPDDRIEIAGWVRNLTNEAYKSLAFDATQAAGFVGAIPGDPRTYGGSISFQF